MRLLTILTFFISSISCGQAKKSLEIALTGRYDKHADYVSNYAGRVYNDTNKLYGYSYGVMAVYRRALWKTYSLYAGIGYYQLRVDKIRGPMPFNIPGTRTERNINYDDGMTSLLYSTSKYHYNNLSAAIGLDKDILIKEHSWFNVGAELIAYYTFSQKYQLFSGTAHYRTHNTKSLEYGLNIHAGFIKDYRKFYLGPSLVIPVYQNLKGDKVFYEDPHMNISKWFSGIGASIKIGKYL